MRVLVASLFLTTLARAAVSQTPAMARAQARHLYTPKERHDAGETILRHAIAAHGLVDNQVWQERVSDVLSRLQRGAAHPGLDLTPAIVGDNEVNAGAAPGGFIIINAGLLRFVDSLGAVDAPGDTVRQRLRSDGYLAAVLGHELAHVTLGHTDRILDGMRRALSPTDSAAALSDPTVYDRELRLKPGLVTTRRMDRGIELAADSLGSLYLLRSGWEIQNALDFMRHMEDFERQSAASAEAPSYVRDHPRSSTREALLEGLRARLKLNQGRLDDALILINHNAELDLAIALLDSVLTDFPTLLAARHARATAYHRKWLNTVPLQAQAVRSSLFTFGAHFMPGIRGAGTPGDTVWLLRTRKEYEAVLAVDSIPGTLSNLAVLDAHTGSRALSLQRAERAAALAPDDPQIRNDLGVVRYLSGDVPGARAEFQRALQGQGAEEDPAVVFNLGKTQAMLDDPQARATLEAYLKLDTGSGWSMAAKKLLGRTPEVAQPDSGPPPPIVAGIPLGLSADSTVRLLGKPDSVHEWPAGGGAFWHYRTRGVTLFVTPGDGLILLQLVAADAGDIEGVRVGDPIRAARSRWGWPTERHEGLLMYIRETWMIEVGYGDPKGKILRLALGSLE